MWLALPSNRIGPCIHIACTQLPNAEPVCTSSPCGADGVSRLLFTLSSASACKPKHHFRRRYCSAQRRVSNAGPHPDLRQPQHHFRNRTTKKENCAGDEPCQHRSHSNIPSASGCYIWTFNLLAPTVLRFLPAQPPNCCRTAPGLGPA